MRRWFQLSRNCVLGITFFSLFLTACAPRMPAPRITATPAPTLTPSATPLPTAGPTPLPTRVAFPPGTKLPYTAQSGDYVVALAKRFNTTEAEILAANPGLTLTSTLPAGLQIEIPAYYQPLGGTPFPLLPDSEFVYGPTAQAFEVRAFLNAQAGPVKNYTAFVNQKQRDAAGTIEYVARQYSLNPKLLLALMEWRTGALTHPNDVPRDMPFGSVPISSSDWYLHMLWVAEQLSIGYYGWRTGDLVQLTLVGDYTVRPDSYHTAGTVGVQYLFSQWLTREEFEQATAPEGFAATYRRLFGDPWANATEVLTGNLTQPELSLPFAENRIWTFTGGPHPAWGQGVPWAALDFAPAGVSGCGSTAEYALAVADGVIARASDSTVVLDLDGDGDEGTGWTIFYFHLAERDMIPTGATVRRGDALGHPSCEGGTSTGTHVHMARRFNGEWMLAYGIVPFNLGGWVAVKGEQPYQGRLERLGAWVEASTNSTAQNRVYWVR